jgi:uncharacterized protein (DUF952 family)
MDRQQSSAKATNDYDTAHVFKIVPADAWNMAQLSGSFTGSADDIRDGFIHLSTAGQVAGTLKRHFAGVQGLVLVAFAAKDLGSHLRFETSRNGELFPHLYASLPAAAALWSRPIALRANGIHEFDCGI